MTNYKCFRDARLIEDSNYIETHLGCLDSIPEVNLDNLTVCEGKLDSETYKIKCCDDEDFCNLALHVTVEPITDTTTEPTQPTDPDSKSRGYRVG